MLTRKAKRKVDVASGNGGRLQRSQRKVEREIDEVGEQLKKIFQKLGLTDEMDSIEKTLYKKFGTHSFAEAGIVKRHGKYFEIGPHAYNDKEFYLVGRCGNLTSYDITYLLTKIEKFPKYFPEHSHRILYGVIAATKLSKTAREEALGKGFYVGLIKDEKFRLQVPRGFKPKAFGPFMS